MARWATLCKIADNDFTGCRAELVDSHQFNSIFAGSVDFNNFGRADAQTFNRGVAGIQFGISMTTAEKTKCDDTIADIASTQTSNAEFVVLITEGKYDLSLYCIPDYSVAGGWFQYDKHSEGWLERVMWRFIAQSVYTAP